MSLANDLEIIQEARQIRTAMNFDSITRKRKV